MRRLVALAFIWGWSFLFIKVAVEGLPPPAVAWGRITLGAVVLYLVVQSQGLELATSRVFLRHFAVIATVGSVVPFTLLAWGEQRITSALTAVLNASTPLFTALIAFLARQERLRPIQGVGLGIGLCGVAIAAGFGASDLQGSSITGALAAVGAGACYGIALVYVRRNLTVLPPLVAASGQLLAGSVILAPLAIGASVVEGVSLSPTRVLAILILGAVGTGGAYVLFYGAIAELGATKASLVTYLIPVVAVVVGVVVLDEPFQWRLVIGGLVTIVGIAAVTLPARGQATAPTPAVEPATIT
ncbi:MAG TPA: DMT family transporter [Acidimicrobiales bacterium]|jgi:drug/metabolite transporter (DMT)-like permease